MSDFRFLHFFILTEFSFFLSFNTLKYSFFELISNVKKYNKYMHIDELNKRVISLLV